MILLNEDQFSITNKAADLILDGKSLKEVSKELKRGKSTIHSYIHKFLPFIDKKKYKKVSKILTKRQKEFKKNNNMDAGRKGLFKR